MKIIEMGISYSTFFAFFIPFFPDWIDENKNILMRKVTLRCTHTCSETSYRIVDVECIGRAKNTPVKPNRRNEKKIYMGLWWPPAAT